MVERLATEVFSRLEEPGSRREQPGQRADACSFLPAVLDKAPEQPALAAMLASFRKVEPDLVWGHGKDKTGTGSENFAADHAEATLIGPDGIEKRDDVWMGVTVMGPHVRYPDHQHPPEEVYLVATDGDFAHGDSGWFTPGVNGSLYNSPDIVHAMRSRDKPFLAFWALLLKP